jgi:hypothetical protein
MLKYEHETASKKAYGHLAHELLLTSPPCGTSQMGAVGGDVGGAGCTGGAGGPGGLGGHIDTTLPRWHEAVGPTEKPFGCPVH